ncbi:MAG: TonB-dependent receptor plug domain-containing protein [Chitinivibrionales bacterium]
MRKIHLLPALIATLLSIASGEANPRSGIKNQESKIVEPDSAEYEQPVKSLDKMVVTATRTKRRLSETPASVSVINPKKMVAAPAKNIDDLLQYETGVQVKRVVGIGEGVPMDIIMRGIPGALVAARTLILVDGFPTNASGTPFLILNEIPMQAIERVEVVRGPYSALYGANALGGVINIITRNGDGAPKVTGQLETAYPYSVGYEFSQEDRERAAKIARQSFTDTYWNTQALIEGGDAAFNYMLSGGFRSAGNYLLRDSAFVRGPNGTRYKSNANHDYRDVRVFGKLGTTVGEGMRLILHTRFFDSELGFGKTGNTDDDVVTLGQKILVGPEALFSVGESDVRIAGFYRRVTGVFDNEEETEITTDGGGTQPVYVPNRWESVSDAGQGEASINIPLGDWQTFTVGLDALYNKIAFGATLNTDTDDTLKPGVTESIYNVAAYIQDEITLAERFSFLPGVRFDYHSEFGGVFSPKFGMHVRLTDELGLRATAGKAFRAPTHTEMYMPDITLRDDYMIQSNPDLDPETVWAFDLGVEYQPLDQLFFKMTGFYNEMEDLIVPGIDIQSMKITHRNASDAWSAGIELETEWAINDLFSFSGNCVLQNSRDESAEKIKEEFGEQNTEVSLDYVPKLSIGGTLLFSRKIASVPVSASMSLSYVGARSYLFWEAIQLSPQYLRVIMTEDERIVYVNPPVQKLDPYVRIDLGVKASIHKNLDIQVGIQNVSNAKIEEHGGTLAPGIFPTIGITGSF